jgi:hypothetical protein
MLARSRQTPRRAISQKAIIIHTNHARKEICPIISQRCQMSPEIVVYQATMALARLQAVGLRFAEILARPG